MTSPISYTKTELSCPLFNAEFDPYNRGYLVVGGGGGENRSGVSNTLALLDISSPSEITVAAQLDLSRDEDSVQSLASLTTKDGLVTFAGINSSATEQQHGKNDHLRSFSVTFPQRKKVKDAANAAEGEKSMGNIAFAGKTSLFRASTDAKARPYQRLLCFSPVRNRELGGKRIGAIASSMATKNEIILFNTTSPSPDSTSVLARIEPEEGSEAVDIDLDEPEKGYFALAYCTDDKVSIYNLTGDSGSEKTNPSKSSGLSDVYSIPKTGKPGSRPTLRCLRWLSAKHLLLLAKIPQGGAELMVLWLGSKAGVGSIVLRKKLPKSLEVAAHLDVCRLDADPATGERQILVAVAGQDRNRESAIHIFTLDYMPSEKDSSLQIRQINDFTVLQRVHPSNIMNLTFSNFFTPRQAPDSTMSIASTTQYVKLASVAWGGTVVIETLSLTSTPTSPSDTAEASTNEPAGTPSVRWVLSSSSLIDRMMSWSGILVAAFAVLLSAFLLQSYLNVTATTTSSLQTALHALTPPGAVPPASRSPLTGIPPLDAASTISSALAAAQAAASGTLASSTPTLRHRLRDLLEIRNRGPSDGSHGAAGDGQHIYVSESESLEDDAASESRGMQGGGAGGISASLHADAAALRAKGARRFEEMGEEERERWRRRLREAGEWGEHLPESLLAGIFFSQWAQVVGGGLRDAVVGA